MAFINIETNDMKVYEDGSDWLEHLTGNYDRIPAIAKEKLGETSDLEVEKIKSERVDASWRLS